MCTTTLPLIYNIDRDYDPGAGRYIQADPNELLSDWRTASVAKMGLLPAATRLGMTSMGWRGLMCGATVVMLGATVSACAPSKDQVSDGSCELKASNAALDESCAIEVSKRESAAKLGGTSYEKYKVHFDPAAKLWIVMAYNESGPPDSHVYLSTGEVKDLRGAP